MSTLGEISTWVLARQTFLVIMEFLTDLAWQKWEEMKTEHERQDERGWLGLFISHLYLLLVLETPKTIFKKYFSLMFSIHHSFWGFLYHLRASQN